MKLRAFALLTAAAGLAALAACHGESVTTPAPELTTPRNLQATWETDSVPTKEIYSGGLRITQHYEQLALGEGTFTQTAFTSDDRGVLIERLATGTWAVRGTDELLITVDHQWGGGASGPQANPQPAPVTPVTTAYRFTDVVGILTLVPECGIGVSCITWRYHRL